jgi:hypothetical protein
MVQEKEKIKSVVKYDDKLRRREKRERDSQRRDEDKYDREVRRRR